MAKHQVLAMFSDFDHAIAAIENIKSGKMPGATIEDITVLSPIEHPDIDIILGKRPVNVQKFTFTGALFGIAFAFFFISSAQASFLVQPQGGKPVIPFPTAFVLMYEQLIFWGVWTTVITFLVLAGMMKKRGNLYSEKLTVDQIGLGLEIDDSKLEGVKEFFRQQQALEIREEKVR